MSEKSLVSAVQYNSMRCVISRDTQMPHHRVQLAPCLRLQKRDPDIKEILSGLAIMKGSAYIFFFVLKPATVKPVMLSVPHPENNKPNKLLQRLIT